MGGKGQQKWFGERVVAVVGGGIETGGRMGKAWKDTDGIWKGRWQWGTGKGLLLGGISTLA